MKKLIFIGIALLLPAAFIISGCGTGKSGVNIGPDGYGKIALPNGITVLVNHDETTSLTAARVLIGGGVLTETAADNGITNLMIRMLLKGNSDMTASEITERLDFLGANVSADCFRDYSAISFMSLTENFDEVLAIISTSLISPTFPDEELIKLKIEVEGDIKGTNDNQTQASSNLFWKTAYGNAYYGLPTLGTIESISGITADDLKSYYGKYVGGANMMFSIATDMPADTITNLVNNRLGGIRPNAETLKAPKLTLQAEKTGFIPFERNQSFIFMGEALDHLDAAEVPYVILLNEVMGNNVGSRLWYLRQKEKLAYAVYTQYALNKYSTVFRAAIGTDTSKVNIALASLGREWKSMVVDGITAEELADAKVNMKNNLIYQIDRKTNRANNMAYYEYIGYNYQFPLELIDMADYITLDQINSFIKENFTDDRRFVSIVGKM